MKRKMMMTVLCAAAVMLTITAPLAAQTTRLNPTSNTNKATASTFGTDIDSYMSVNDYSSVELSKMFAYISLDNNNLDLGFAKKIGGMYLGARYAGDLLNQINGKEDTTSVTTVIDVNNGLAAGTNKTTTKTITDDDILYTDNHAQVLLGLIGMGFKLGFDEYMAADTGFVDGDVLSTVITDTADNSSTKTEFTEYSQRDGYIAPSVQWGMNLPLGGMTLKPNAKIAVGFVKDTKKYTKDETKSVAGAVPFGFATKNTVYLRDDGAIVPDVTLGANLQFAKKDGGQSAVGLEYGLNLPLYGDGKTTTTTVKTTQLNTGSKVDTSDETVANTEYSEMTNTVTPSYSFTKDLGEKVSFGFNAKAKVTMFKSESTPKTIQTVVTNTDTYSQNPDTDTVTTVVTTTNDYTTAINQLTINPTLNFGFTYKIIPGKFALNAGYAVTAPSFSNKVEAKSSSTPIGNTVATTTRTGDVITTDTLTTPVDTGYTNAGNAETETTTTTWGQLSGELFFGTRFNFTEQFALDAYTTLNTTGTASLFGTTGNRGILTNSYNLAFTVKY